MIRQGARLDRWRRRRERNWSYRWRTRWVGERKYVYRKVGGIEWSKQILQIQRLREKWLETSDLRLLLTLGLLLTLAGRLRLLLGAGAVHLVEESKGGGLELIGLGLEVLGGGGTLTSLVLGNELTEAGNLLLDLLGLSLVEAVLELLEGLLGVVKDTVGLVGGLDGLLALLISSTVLLGVVNHVLNLRVAQTGTRGNGDGLVLSGRLVGGVNVDD